MEFVLLAVAGAGGLTWLGYRLHQRRGRNRERSADLAQVRTLCEEDVTLLGEQLRRLDDEIGDEILDDDTRFDYQTALDAYESAKGTVARIKDPDEISKVTDTLASGRYALACVQARVEGRPLPELRVPCFFNPQHGPSVIDVAFTPPGRGTRKVPACAMDAARLKEGEKPEVREVEIGGTWRPYFDAGDAFLPYAQGYFVHSLATQSLFIVPPVMGADFGPHAANTFDGGGGDVGGGDFG